MWNRILVTKILWQSLQIGLIENLIRKASTTPVFFVLEVKIIKKVGLLPCIKLGL